MKLLGFLMFAALIGGGVYLFFLSEVPPVGKKTNSGPETAEKNPCNFIPKPPRYIQKQSCDSSACHGGIQPATHPTSILRNEYRTWFDHDPHSNAARVLGNEVSQRIVQHLAGENPEPARYTTIYERCLACHNTTVAKVPNHLVTNMVDFDLEPEHEGVGCQACHGPSSEWQDLHYYPCWKELPGRDKLALGYYDTEPLLNRAELCSSCHVGDEGRDVNHDLIAAGHPQMKFELAAYHSALPPHWNTERDRAKVDDFDVRLWIVGQWISANAALQQLERRASYAQMDPRPALTTWPEFAEYDCFACHHDLQLENWRRDRGFVPSNHRIGLPWGVWPFAMLPTLANRENDNAGQTYFLSHKKLQTLMQQSIAPNPQDVALRAKATRIALELWIQQQPNASPYQRTLETLRSHASAIPIRTWDDAVHLYLATRALQDAAGKPQETEDLLDELPEDFPKPWASPDEIRQRLQAIWQKLPNR